MHVNDLITLTREYIDEPSIDASDWTDSNLISYMNREQEHLFSVVRNTQKDWLGREWVFLPTTEERSYWLPLDFISPRRVELIDQSSVSGSSPFYTIDESKTNSIEVDPLGLNDKDCATYYNSSIRRYSIEGYYLYDGQIRFDSGLSLSSGNYIRIFYTPTAADLHRATAQAGGANTITLGNQNATTTLGPISALDNYYNKMLIEIVSGAGAGQLKRITQYNGTTKVATVDSAWSTTPDSTSVYSIISPIIKDYHELLALGAAIRAKGLKTEDDTSEIAQVYMGLMEEFKKTLEPRVLQRTRRIVRR